MISRWVVYGIIIVLAGAAVALSQPVNGADESDCVAMVEKKCTDCHSTTRICRRLVKNRAEIWWKSNIDNMIDYGAEYTEKERTEILSCLMKPYSEIERLCE